MEQCYIRRTKRRSHRPKISILPRGISHPGFWSWWRGREKSVTAAEGRKQRITVWARAKSKTSKYVACFLST
jgi:hypothetical protein